MQRRLVLAVLPLAVLGVAAAPSFAAPKPKPITKSFTAAATPDPAPNATGSCTEGAPGIGEHVETFTVPAAGTLKVELTGFQGDWDLCVRDAGGDTLGSSVGFVEATTEVVSLKFKKKTPITIVAQNGIGGPTAAGKYTFTYK